MPPGPEIKKRLVSRSSGFGQAEDRWLVTLQKYEEGTVDILVKKHSAIGACYVFIDLGNGMMSYVTSCTENTLGKRAGA